MTKQCMIKKIDYSWNDTEDYWIPTLLRIYSNRAWICCKPSFGLRIRMNACRFSSINQFQARLESFPCKVRIYRFIFWKHTYKQIQARLETSPSKVGINSNLSWTCVQPSLELVLSSLGKIANLAWTCFQPCSEFLDIYLSTPSSASFHDSQLERKL